MLKNGYHEIYSDLKSQIQSGELPFGGALPSEAKLSKLYRVSRATVRQGLKLLEEGGLLEVVPGRGRRIGRRPQAEEARADVAKGTILFLAGPGRGDFGDPFLGGIHDGAVQALRAAGWGWDLRFQRERREDPAQLLRDGDTHEGVLLSGIYFPDAEERLDRGRPVVQLNVRSLNGAPSVGVDGYAAGIGSARKLLALGHRRMGLLGWDTPDRSFRERGEGFLRGCEEGGVARESVAALWRLEWTRDDPDGSRRMRASLEDLRKAGRTPTAFFVVLDDLAMRLIDQLEGMGLAVPGDVSVIGYDHLVREAHANKVILSTWEQPGFEVGRRGARMLLERIANPDGPPAVELVMPKWIEGPSIAACKGSQIMGTGEKA
ncbi:MAG: substrate-binding domain-containing protein [Planctomycetes bacterium]|nr:substrate-binding domain-containing protein [Planctomycetota bacterium]